MNCSSSRGRVMVALGTRGGKSLRNENTHVKENWVKRLQENAERTERKGRSGTWRL